METMFLTYQNPNYNVGKRAVSTPFKERASHSVVFDSFTKTKKPEESHVVRNSTLTGAALGLSYSIYKSISQSKVLSSFEAYKESAFKKAKAAGDDLAKLTDDVLKEEMKLAKENRKFVVPMLIAFWTGAGAFVGVIAGQFAKLFSKDSWE